MSRFIFIFCFVLPVIKVCNAALRDGMDCPTGASIASKLNRSQTGIPLNFRANDTLECPCVEQLCISLCCPLGSSMIRAGNCTSVKNRTILEFPPQHDPRTLEELPEQLTIDDFLVVPWYSCEGDGVMYQLEPDDNPNDEYKFFANGSIYFPVYDMTFDFMDYCLGAVNGANVYKIVVCVPVDNLDDYLNTITMTVPHLSLLVTELISVSFFLVTFVVYSIVPELKNIHGATLRGYIGMLIVTYTIMDSALVLEFESGSTMCIFWATTAYFCSMTSAFWLNVMSFDIWWTFREFRSFKDGVRRWERKKFLIYSAYAWGIPLLITVICLIMDYTPGVSKSITRPKFKEICWFSTEDAETIYYFGPIFVTVMCNTYFFVSTAMKIKQHKKDTARRLKGMNSRRHDNNKQRFNIYFKLFVVMGTNWSTDIICWLCSNRPKYLWYIVDSINNLHGILIFVIFVCKKKIGRLLLKRFGCWDRNRTAAAVTQLQEKHNSNSERTKTSTDESDYPRGLGQ